MEGEKNDVSISSTRLLQFYHLCYKKMQHPCFQLGKFGIPLVGQLCHVTVVYMYTQEMNIV